MDTLNIYWKNFRDGKKKGHSEKLGNTQTGLQI